MFILGMSFFAPFRNDVILQLGVHGLCFTDMSLWSISCGLVPEVSLWNTHDEVYSEGCQSGLFAAFCH